VLIQNSQNQSCLLSARPGEAEEKVLAFLKNSNLTKLLYCPRLQVGRKPAGTAARTPQRGPPRTSPVMGLGPKFRRPVGSFSRPFVVSKSDFNAMIGRNTEI
jgi:hypothetical protein